MTGKLFVYGEFCKEGSQFHTLENHVEEVHEAKIRGQIFLRESGYPVYLNRGEYLVEGQMIEFKASDIIWALLDQLHGCNKIKPEKSTYFRLNAKVLKQTDSGQEIDDCFVYAINPEKLPRSARLMEGGAWREYLRKHPPLDRRLTEEQRTYVKKLANCKGRDIVPIKLPLYRDLMRLGLIVDKGRRLALSSLGKEVSQYL